MSKTKTPSSSAAWFEIAVKNLDKASKFYGDGARRRSEAGEDGADGHRHLPL